MLPTSTPLPLPQRRDLILGLFVSALAWPTPRLHAQPVTARRIEDQLFAAEQRVGGARLGLIGAGVFARFGVKPYAAGLYLAEPADDAATIVKASGPKRVQLRMLRELPATEFSKALAKGVRRNASPAQQQDFDAALGVLTAQIDSIVTARKGDVVDLDFDPSQGMSLRLNGTLKGPALAGPGGVELYAATLLSFVGERPYSPELRAAMLGRKAP